MSDNYMLQRDLLDLVLLRVVHDYNLSIGIDLAGIFLHLMIPLRWKPSYLCRRRRY